MVNQIILLTLLISAAACGKKVNISTQKLQSASELNAVSAYTNGSLERGTPDKITTNGSTYVVSKYSSGLSLQFIKTIPMGQTIQIKYKGEVTNGELLLNELENQ